MENTTINLSNDSKADSLPDETCTCKFVLIRVGGVWHLVFGLLREFRYHAALVERFCRLHGIATAWVVEPEQIEIDDRDVELGGGGYIRFEPEKAAVDVFGYSTVYGGFDRHVLRDIIRDDAAWTPVTLSIED
ncbi:MAG: hypothetical protein JSU65_08000 [Candidatus Zixiibacteriota bacterium]|nr:MAG: hypothetical protein JSU65_08000 [candidate division Zixibacteria bacterium]